MYSDQIIYKGRHIPKGCPDKEKAARLLLDQIIAESKISYSEEEVEEELMMEWAGFLQKMRYRL